MLSKLPILLGLIILRLFSYLPITWLNSIGGIVGSLLYYILKRRRNIVILNLSLCFPEMSQHDKQQLTKQHFQELVRSGLCYGFLFYANSAKYKRVFKIRGMEYLTEHLGKRPIIILAPHFLALDIGGHRISIETAGYSIYSQPRNAYLNQRIKEARSRFSKGTELFSRQEGLHKIIRKMRHNPLPFYYLPDQDMDEKNSVYVPFFAHQSCATLDVLPKMAKLTNALIIPMATYREGNHYVVEFSKAWENYPSGDTITDVSYMNKCIEQMILKHPSQYLWLHKRFKTQPNLPRGKFYENC